MLQVFIDVCVVIKVQVIVQGENKIFYVCFNLYLTRKTSLRLKISFLGVSWPRRAAAQSSKFLADDEQPYVQINMRYMNTLKKKHEITSKAANISQN